MRGYWAIGVYQPKTSENIGTLWRSAYIFGAAYIFTIGRRYKEQASDTLKASRHVPLYNFPTFADFKNNLPYGARLVCVETGEDVRPLDNFIHPERAVYLLGAEDNGIPVEILKGNQVVQIPTYRGYCVNVAVAGSIIMYDRFVKQASFSCGLADKEK